MDTRKIEKYIQRRNQRRKWLSIVTVLAVAASMLTNAMLTNPVDALTGSLICEKEEHTHTNECYITKPVHVGCTENTKEQHLHGQTCYDAEGHLICNKDEYVIIHTHDNNCYDKDGNLICGMPEVEEHIHDASCYDAEGHVICGKREIKEHREHTEECYTTNEAGERVLTCTYPIAIRHQHAMACYDQTEMTLICGKEEHVHCDDCYEHIEEPIQEETIAEEEIQPETAAEEIAAEQTPAEETITEDIPEEVTEKVPADSAAETAEELVEAIPTETVTEEPTAEVQTETIEETITEENTEVPAEVQEETNHKETEENTESAPTVIEEDGKKIVFTEEETDKPAETAEENKEEVTEDKETEEPSEEKKDEEVTEDKKPEEEQKEDKKDTEDKKEEETEETPQMPAVSFENADTDVVVTVTAEEGSFPAGTTMKVVPVAAEEVTDAIQNTTEKSVVEIQAVDISFWYQEEEIEPLKAINVVMKPKAVTAEADHTAVVHVKDEGETEVVVEETEGVQEEVTFDTPEFSVYAIVYTVDFHYEVNGNTYDYSIKGGTGISLRELLVLLGTVSEEDSQKFIKEIDTVTVSDPSLAEIIKAEEDTTIGAVKEAHSIVTEYSSETATEEITENNNKVITAGDWVFISKMPFDTDETMTITMKDGQSFLVAVTDEQRVEQTADLQVDVNNSYIICTERNGQYYVLKTDGTTEVFTTTAGFDKLGAEYQWTFYYVFKEKDQLHNLDKEYFFIRPIADKTITLSLNSAGQPLLQNGTNNIGVLPQDGGFVFEGYTRDHVHDTQLYFNGTGFEGNTENNSIISIYQQDPLPTYSFTVKTSDDTKGKVSGRDENNVNRNNVSEYIAASDEDKFNRDTITAVPVTHRDSRGRNKWIFDYWDIDGAEVDGVSETISPGTVYIPSNSSVLTAHFKQNPDYDVPDSEKEGTSFPEMRTWLENLKTRNIPLNDSGCSKTAEVYDYENRIYRVDLTAQSSLTTFDGTIDLGFVLDISKSMDFPATLKPYKENVEIYKINNNNSNKNWLSGNGPYYLIADEEQTATVFRLFKSGGNWYAIDASKYVSDTSESDRFKIGDKFSTAWCTNEKFPFHANDNNSSKYTIYYDARPGVSRFDDLGSSMTSTVTAMGDLLKLLNIAKNNSDDPEVKIAYTTFHGDTPDQKSGMPHSYTFNSADGYSSAIFQGLAQNGAGGTSTELAMANATNFRWEQGATRYVVLITDGAPQKGGKEIANNTVINAANSLKTNGTTTPTDDVKLITVGLSMGNVDRGRVLLYELADEVNGEKAFYSAEGDNLEDVLLHIMKQIMRDAIVEGKVTDTVNEAFYPVNKETGMPLLPGDRIDLDGNKVTMAYTGPVGVVQEDGRTIAREGQEFTWEGWQGTIYVKAKEDLLGGNAVLTNDLEQPANIETKGYKFNPGDDLIPFDSDDRIWNQNFDSTKDFESPRVNVNELSFSQNQTEWTVYIGTEVDPKEQIRKLYESIEVEQVVTNARDTDNDKLPDTVYYKEGDTDNNYYPLTKDSISDQRESEVQDGKERYTFYLKDLIGKIADHTAAGSLNWWNYETHEIKMDEFIAAASAEAGITLDYDEYGLDKHHTDNSTINIRLTSEVAADEAGLTDSPHTATVIGSPAEKYTLKIVYSPDYSVTPIGQGGQSTDNFHVGIYGTLYQGHAAGTETSENVHLINVYAKPLDVLKTNEDNEPLAGAVFELYRIARTGESGVSLSDYDKDLKGSYYKVSSAVSGTDGIAHIAPVSDGMKAKDLLVPGETYYLIETAAPNNYERDRSVRVIAVETENGKYTDLKNNEIESKVYPFNWNQGARILSDGTPVSVTAVDHDTDPAGTEEVTDGSYVSNADAISFHTAILNKKSNITIKVEKTWDSDNHPDHIEFKLYRTAYISHDWDDGEVIKEATCTEDGAIRYICHHCGETKGVAVSKTGHTPAEPVRENVVEPTCTTPGEYDLVTHYATCGAELAREHIQVEALGHDWGEWTVTTPATYDAPGVETRVCKNDPSHVETREIPKLIKETRITYRFYREFWGNGVQYSETVTSELYPVGSTITFTFTDENANSPVIHKDAVRNRYSFFELDYYTFSGGTRPRVTRSGNTYSASITVSDGMVLDIMIGSWNVNPHNITI